MTDQLLLQGPRKGECGCQCGVFGTLRKNPWPSNGVTCVTRGCNCRQCTGRRSGRGGYRDQRNRGTKEIAGKRGRKHEEDDRFAFRWSNKRDARYAAPVFKAFDVVRDAVGRGLGRGNLVAFMVEDGGVMTSYASLEAEDEQRKPIGDIRPFLARYGRSSARHGLIVIRGDKLREVWQAIGIENEWLR